MFPGLVGASTTAWALGFVGAIVFFGLWFYCLFDVLARPARGPGSKALWAVALVLLAPFAIVAYLLFGRGRSG
jgi:Phospholipase_D-nuclease N-terminal